MSADEGSRSSSPEPEDRPRLERLLAQLEEERSRLERAENAEQVVDILGELAELAREVQTEIDRIRREGADALS